MYSLLSLKLDLEQDLYSQGPFDVLIHKLTDVIIRANLGDKKVSIKWLIYRFG